MKFPKTVYVRIITDGDEEYLAVSDTPTEGIEEGERVDVATFELKQITIVEWTKDVSLTPSKRRQ